MNITLHIEHLILEGLPVTGGQGALVQGAVEQELARLLTTHGLWDALRTGGAVPQVRGRDLEIGTGNPPARLGQQIAQSVYGGIGKKR